jgi:cell division transport system ATP-binding protein
MIKFEDVSVVYHNGTWGLRGVATEIGVGEFVFLVGPTGEGKTTFLRLIYREVICAQGRVLVDGLDVAKLPARKVPGLRRKVGVVFQDFRLLADRTVFENVAFALRVVGRTNAEIEQRVPVLLSGVGLDAKRHSLPRELSCGEQQRVAVARALADGPSILLADEPTGNLDPETSLDIVRLLAAINDLGTTVIVATHDQMIVDRMQKRVITLAGGRIVDDRRQGTYALASP